MSYRDDGDALLARMAALEAEAGRARELQVRVHQLEAANRELQRRLDAYEKWSARVDTATTHRVRPPVVVLNETIVATRVREIVAQLALFQRVTSALEVSLPIEPHHIAEAAGALAAADGRTQPSSDELDAAARDVLSSRLLLRPDATQTIEQIIDAIVRAK